MSEKNNSILIQLGEKTIESLAHGKKAKRKVELNFPHSLYDFVCFTSIIFLVMISISFRVSRHAMTFRHSTGFPQSYLSVENPEYSHIRLKRTVWEGPTKFVHCYRGSLFNRLNLCSK